MNDQTSDPAILRALREAFAMSFVLYVVRQRGDEYPNAHDLQCFRAVAAMGEDMAEHGQTQARPDVQTPSAAHFDAVLNAVAQILDEGTDTIAEKLAPKQLNDRSLHP